MHHRRPLRNRLAKCQRSQSSSFPCKAQFGDARKARQKSSHMKSRKEEWTRRAGLVLTTNDPGFGQAGELTFSILSQAFTRSMRSVITKADDIFVNLSKLRCVTVSMCSSLSINEGQRRQSKLKDHKTCLVPCRSAAVPTQKECLATPASLY